MHDKVAYRPDIQGLRAIAVAIVIAAHSGVPGFSGGFIGVDIFFVLSGYLITGLLAGEYLDTGTIRFADFLSRRLRRLLPALLVVLSIVCVVSLATMSPYEARVQSASLPYAITWTSNLYFALADRDYFHPIEARDLFLHTWSLGVEEQFYIVWPILVFLSLRLIRRDRSIAQTRIRFIVFLGALLVSSLVLSLDWAATTPPLSFYLMPSRGWQFALGAATFAFGPDFKRANESCGEGDGTARLRVGMGIVGALLIFASTVLFHGEMNYPGLYALLPSAGAAFIITAGGGAHAVGASRILGCRTLVWVGDRSYALYLWHWPLLLLAPALGMPATPFALTLLILATLLLADATYRYVEYPFWKGRWKKAKPTTAVLASIAAMLFVFTAVQELRKQIYGEEIARGFEIAYDVQSDLPPLYAQGCDTWVNSAEVVACLAGNTQGTATIVLVGDSIGVQWYSLLPEIFRSSQWRIVTFTKSACPIVDVDYFYERIGRPYEVCSTWRRRVIDRIRSMKPRYVLVGSSSGYGFSESEWVDGTTRILATLSEAADVVALIPGTPMLDFDGPDCISRQRASAFQVQEIRSACSEPVANSNSVTVSGYLARAAGRFDNVRILELADLACPNDVCSAMDEAGVVVFRDKLHLSNRYVRSLLPTVRDRLEAIGIDQT